MNGKKENKGGWRKRRSMRIRYEWKERKKRRSVKMKEETMRKGENGRLWEEKDEKEAKKRKKGGKRVKKLASD